MKLNIATFMEAMTDQPDPVHKGWFKKDAGNYEETGYVSYKLTDNSETVKQWEKDVKQKRGFEKFMEHEGHKAALVWLPTFYGIKSYQLVWLAEN